VIATVDEEIAARVGKLAFFDIFDPGAIDANRDVVLCFASHCAGVAANTLALVDDKGVFRHDGFPLVGYKRNDAIIEMQTATLLSQLDCVSAV
jgi:hypothetical protein